MLSEGWHPLRSMSSMSFGLFIDALADSGLTEDEETTATSGPDEAVRAGGVMALDHFQDTAVDSSILTAHSILQTFQILQKCTNLIQNQSF